MTDYIKREDALDIICKHYGANTNPITREQAEDDLYVRGLYMAQEAVKGFVPSADAAPVVHGEWKDTENPDTVECSNCHVCEAMWFSDFPWCPSCGARMDGDRND